MSEEKSLGKIMNEIGRKELEVSFLMDELSSALQRAYVAERETLRQRPVEEIMEEAYEANEKVDRRLARRKMLLKTIRRAQEQGIGSGNRIFEMCVNDKCFCAYPEFDLASCSYRSIVGWRKGK